MTKQLIEKGEVLFRQIHPEHYQENEPNSSCFMPSSKDNGKLSVDRETFTTAKDSFELFQSNGFKSKYVYGVSVGEFLDEDITCFTDPLEPTTTQKANIAHCLADYNEHKSSQQKIKAKRLKRYAIERGKLHP